MYKRIWITWETQRRSIELSRALGCKLFLFDIPGIKRYPLSVIKTIYTLIKYRPSILFVQNPSMFLATLACFIGSFTRLKIVVDRHTTFRLNKPHSGSFSIWLFMRMHYYTLKFADLTIVTNQFLADLVVKAGGHPFVLPDKLPDLTPKKQMPLIGDTNVLLISSFGNDEPITEVLSAAQELSKGFHFYITGNFRKKYSNQPVVPSNVTLTGFLSEDDFINHIFSCDIVLVLTKSDYCMLCGCYEAVATEKPLITSDKIVLREYFTEAVFVNNTYTEIVTAITTVAADLNKYKENSKNMKRTITEDWNRVFSKLRIELDEYTL